MTMAIVSILTTLLGSFLTVRYLFLCNFKIDNSIFSVLYDNIKDIKWKIITDEEIGKDLLYPNLFSGYFWAKDCPPFFLNYSTPQNSEENNAVGSITCVRWSAKKLKQKLISAFKEKELVTGIPIEVVQPWWSRRIGLLREKIEPILNCQVCKDFDNDVQKMLNGEFNKTSAILYGTPGNGKTTFIKYLATKYKLPIKIVTLSPELTNNDIMYIFSRIKDNAVVLLEDFDNSFDGRNCIIGQSNNGGNNMNINFTFDAILNSLDGVFNSYKNTVFIMTVNDINKVDSALKGRPSRFKYMIEFNNPDALLREKLVGEWADPLPEVNLDQLLRIKEFKEQGFTYEDSLKRLGINNE